MTAKSARTDMKSMRGTTANRKMTATHARNDPRSNRTMTAMSARIDPQR